ncbi:MAG TPA: hypothetical protein VL096_16575, partial [Pirellulaceae bacterium]|nr:hypothetical protein [Pirellulaceae bacterium]
MTASTTIRPAKPARPSAQTAETGAKQVATGPWYAQTWSLALVSSLLLWVALSPLGWSGLAWVAPIGWLLLIRSERLTGWRPYFVLWCAGLVHWLLVLEGIRTAYWALYFGWIALAMYLACYLPAFVALTRFAVQRWRAPLVIAAPLVWAGLELFRGYFLTGFALALLGHTQVGFTPLIQVADLAGAYMVSIVVMCVAAGIAQALPWQQARWQWRPLLVSTTVLAITLGYGVWRMREALPEASQGEPLRVALLQ